LSIFKDHAPEYFDQGLQVVPITPNSKAPKISDWVNKDFSELIDQYPNYGIGLKLGSCSGVVALDIDTDDKAILDALPPSPVRKRGAKGETRFFKYNGEKNQKFRTKGYEILSDGNQTVIPPTLHPEGMNYQWLGKDLLSYGVEDLPELVIGEVNIQLSEPVKTGRHNALIDIAGAMIGRDESIDVIAEELFRYDEENHNPPYFTDKKEGHEGKGYAAALRLIASVMVTHHNNGGNYSPAPIIDISEFDNEIVFKRDHKKLPNLRGIGAEMSQYIYENAPVPRRETTIASAISTISTLAGNRFRIGNILPNMYSLMVLPSGSGKDFPLKFPQRLFHDAGLTRLIGESHPASDSAIMAQLPKQRIRLDMIDEASILFEAISSGKNSYQKKMSDVYANLYTSSGDYFGGKNTLTMQSKDNAKGNIGECYAPYVSILGAMTPKAFNDSFTTSLMETGLGSRFLIFHDDRKKRERLVTDITPIPRNIIKHARCWAMPEIIVDADPSGRIDIPLLEMTKQAKNYLNKVREEIIDKKMNTDDDSKLKGVYNRALVTVIKLSMIDACSDTLDPKQVKLRIENIKWAKSFMDAMLYNLEEFVNVNVSENYNEKMFNKVISIIKRNGSITRSEFTSKTRGIPIPIKDKIIGELVKSGDIVQYKTSPNGKDILNYKWVTN
jgi:hypothetical protein